MAAPYQIIFYHCLIQMPFPGHLFMPFYRIKSRRALTVYSANIYICFKSSDTHFYDFFYLFCFRPLFDLVDGGGGIRF